jgi:citronellyl-CoA dehydrogenase
MQFTPEHEAIRNTVVKFIDKEINPYCDQWEKDGIFPAHELFKKMGNLGLLGIAKPEKYGGMGLDYSYQIVFSEELGRIASGGVSMAIGVQTDMATPAMAKFGSDYMVKRYAPSPSASLMQAPMSPTLKPLRLKTVTTILSTARRYGPAALNILI